MKMSWSFLCPAAAVFASLASHSAAFGLSLPSLPISSPISAAHADDDSVTYKKIMDEVGPSLVTVKFVLKVEGGSDFMGGLNDHEMETTGFLLDGKGLVVCSNLQMGGYYSLMARGQGPTITPTDVKVLIGDDTEGKKAKVLTRDTELDLAWVKLDEESTSELKHVDMEKGVPATLGSKLYLISRLGKFFDRAMVVTEGKVSGEIEKPRKLLAPSRSLAADRSDLGMPVFNADGKVVGMVVLQIPDAESMEGDSSGDLGGGPMILPAAEVVKATKLALEAAAKNPPPAEKPATPEAAPAPAPTPETK